MSLPVILGIGVLGGIGAIARFLLDRQVAGWTGSELPYGTCAVNILGAIVLGLLVGASLGGAAYRLVGTGLIGAFTTFSTWMFESHRLGEDGRLRAGLLNVALSLIVGVLAGLAGRHLGAAL